MSLVAPLWCYLFIYAANYGLIGGAMASWGIAGTHLLLTLAYVVSHHTGRHPDEQ